MELRSSVITVGEKPSDKFNRKQDFGKTAGLTKAS